MKKAFMIFHLIVKSNVFISAMMEKTKTRKESQIACDLSRGGQYQEPGSPTRLCAGPAVSPWAQEEASRVSLQHRFPDVLLS